MASEFLPIITNKHRQAAERLASLMDKRTRAVKAQATIDDVAQGYGNDLGDLIQELLRGGHRLSNSDFRRDMEKLIKDYARQVFDVGWEEGGGDVTDMESDDLALLDGFTTEQQGYVADFSDWLTDRESDLDIVPNRVALWVASMANLGQQAKARAMGDPLLIYDGDDGEESCDECQEYKGQTHRLSWWDKRGLLARNGNPNFGCRRFDNCHHSYFHARTGEKVID